MVHERFLTDTALYADVVLPAPTMLETADLYRSYGQFFIQRTRPVIPPLGRVPPNWETIQTLAQALGLKDEVFSRSADEHIDAILAVSSPWLEGLDREALDAGRAVRLYPPRGAWLTPSGKIELRNERLEGAAPPAPADARRSGAAGLPFGCRRRRRSIV